MPYWPTRSPGSAIAAMLRPNGGMGSRPRKCGITNIEAYATALASVPAIAALPAAGPRRHPSSTVTTPPPMRSSGSTDTGSGIDVSAVRRRSAHVRMAAASSTVTTKPAPAHQKRRAAASVPARSMNSPTSSAAAGYAGRM